MTKLLAVCAALLLSACATVSPRAASPVPLVQKVDVSRYMGDWYVIAHIPSDGDREAHNAVENYRLNQDGSVATTYTNRLGGFDGKPKRLTPTLYPVEGSNNALWDVVFYWFWPFRYEYRIAHLEPDYSAVVVARSKLDYAWVMSRKPAMSERQIERYTKMLAGWGYDTTKLVRVPQQQGKR